MKTLRSFAIVGWILLLPLGLRSAAAAADGQPGVIEVETAFGIELVSLRPTAAGQMLDLRFKVIDPEKARPILDKGNKAFLMDAASGKVLPVPVTKAGSMRQTTLKPEAGRMYFMLFSNPGRLVREGSRVSLVIGRFRKDGIVVDASGAPPGPQRQATEKPGT
jgi:hypothetical protein